MSARMLPLRAVAAVPLLLLLHALVRETPMPPAMALTFAGYAAASALWPAACLAVLAAVVPLAATIGSQWGLPAHGSDAVVIAFLTGAILRMAARPGTSTRTPPGVACAAATFATLVFASWLVELVMLQYTTDFPGHFTRDVWRFFTRDFFRDPGAFTRLNDALLLLEGTALAVCVTRFSDAARVTPRAIVRMTVVAATAAAALNVQRLVQIALQHGGGWEMLLALAPTTRLSVVHTDVNAGGSYFAMVLPIAIALGTERRAQIPWLAAAAAIATALWMTGSRTAMAAAGLGIVLCLAAGIGIAHTRTQRRWLIGGLAAALLLILTGVLLYPESRNTSTSTALDVRRDMGRAAFALFETRPVFGIGVGTFWQRSGEYIPARLKQTYAHENAHNNFLQILAELGITGLAAFLALIAAATLPLRWQADPDRWLAVGTVCGLVAFLLTCLTGHPLLTREVAYPFWLLLGATAALRPTRTPEASVTTFPRVPLTTAAAVVVLVALIAATLPFRVEQEKLTRNFENVSIGYSLWSTSDDGVRFRWAQPRSRFFVPANTSYVLIPLRMGPLGPDSSVVTVRLDGRLANTVTVLRDRWTIARVVLAAGRFTSGYRMIELDCNGPDDQAPALMVGRPGL